MGFRPITNSFVKFFRIRILVKISRFFYREQLFSRVFVSILNINFLYIALLLWCIYLILFFFNCFWNKISYKEKKIILILYHSSTDSCQIHEYIAWCVTSVTKMIKVNFKRKKSIKNYHKNCIMVEVSKSNEERRAIEHVLTKYFWNIKSNLQWKKQKKTPKIAWSKSKFFRNLHSQLFHKTWWKNFLAPKFILKTTKFATLSCGRIAYNIFFNNITKALTSVFDFWFLVNSL